MAAVLLLIVPTGSRSEEAPSLPSPSAVERPERRPNGFSLDGLRVASAKIVEGGPPRDAIHSVDAPRMAKPAEARWVRGWTPVIGVAVGEEARCYPVHLMEYHQVVNDVVGGRPLAITYDPLTDSAIAYDRRLKGKKREFGVSGLIYSSNFLLFDRGRDNLWSQFLGEALAGPDAGTKLQRVRTRVEPMAIWLERHPETLVLEPPERRRIDYRHSRYSSYWVSEEVVFPVEAVDDRFHPKELVLGVSVGGHSRAYVASIVTRARGRIVDELEGHRIRVVYEPKTGTFSFEAPDAVQVTSSYWFAWKAFHPDTEIWQEALP